MPAPLMLLKASVAKPSPSNLMSQLKPHGEMCFQSSTSRETFAQLAEHVRIDHPCFTAEYLYDRHLEIALGGTPHGIGNGQSDAVLARRNRNVFGGNPLRG